MDRVEYLVLDPQIIIKILAITTLAFICSMLFTPFLTNLLYKYKFWKQIKDTDISGKQAKVFYKLHKHKQRERIPTAAGIMFWVVGGLITVVLNLSRSQTFLPLFFLLAGGALGLIDDYINIKSFRKGIKGIKAITKLFWQLLIAGFGAWWFYVKLGFDIIHIPGIGDFTIGWWYIPIFILIIVTTANAVNISDGLDGLAGGLSIFAFTGYGVIAMVQGNIGIALFCGTLVGVLLAYTWFNIYPARFFMGDTGSMALGATLGAIAMLTNSVFVLPIIGFVFLIEILSSLIQMICKKLFNKKIFLCAPLHHHFEAMGWPETKVTMRFWILGIITCIIGVIFGLVGGGV
ncbi:MAG: phospho-N-acetylmuramoyl-pentapeptide-transferase [bacterium]